MTTVEPGRPCPHCGREDPRAVWEQRMQQTRARTMLIAELANYDHLSASVKAEILTGTRLLADVLSEHDNRNSAPHNEGDQQ